MLTKLTCSGSCTLHFVQNHFNLPGQIEIVSWVVAPAYVLFGSFLHHGFFALASESAISLPSLWSFVQGYFFCG